MRRQVLTGLMVVALSSCTQSQGTPGPQGERGEAGLAGARGETGAKGDTGAAGSAGPTGETGSPGLTGAQGVEGPAGPQGIPGVAGPIGPTGLPGIQGPAGDTGATGPQGPAGPQGVAGATGPEGPAGPQGASGLLSDLGCFEGQRTTWTGDGWTCSQDATELPVGPITRFQRLQVSYGPTTASERASYGVVRGGGVRKLNGRGVPRRLILEGAVATASGQQLNTNNFTVALQSSPTFSSRVTRVNLSSLWVNVIQSVNRVLPGDLSRVRIDLVARNPFNQPPGNNSEIFAWYNQTSPAAQRRTLTVSMLGPTAGGSVHWQFVDCALVNWEPVYSSAGEHDELTTLDCRLNGLVMPGRPALAAWIMGLTGPNALRVLQIDHHELATQQPQPIRSTRYVDAFPVRYTFPVLDLHTQGDAYDAIEFQANQLTF